MKKVYKLAAVLGLGLAMGPWAVAQAPAAQTATAPVVAATIPLDQQPTKEQLAKLFEVMRLRQQLDGVMKMMPAMMQQQVQVQMKELLAKQSGAGSITPDQQAAITAFQNKYMAKAMGMYTVDEMISDMSGLYQRHLSRTDIDAFIAFYGSPAGQHLLDQQPAIMKEYMPMVMGRVQERTKALTDEMADDLAQLSKSMTPADKPAQK